MDLETWTDGQEGATVTVDGHELGMAYRDDGPDGASTGENGDGEDTPVVFLHGIPTWSFLWREVAPAIAADRRVIVPDLVGYGNSAMHDGFDRSIRAQEEALADLLDGLGLDRVSIVAHDIGGGVALRYAAHNPESVEALVLSNAVCYDSWPVQFVSDLGLPDTTETPIEELETQVSGAFELGVYAEEADPEFVEGLAAPWLSAEGRTSLARCAVATNTNHTTEIDYGEIEADLLCLWGVEDSFQPIEYGERLAAELDGELIGLEEAYHWVVEDRTEAYVEELRAFLGGA
ncbi:alpha/beta hydrolase [Halobacteriales archaeon QS_4_69_34]|nr:MAG: alpha/beta hydrolase [Halobacteriales archaeon QS_4_69_34]